MVHETIRVLIIEDNLPDSRLIQTYLESTGDALFTWNVEENLAQGLARVTKGNIDIILVNLCLPDSVGMGTLDRLKAVAGDIPIVVMTSKDDRALGIQAVGLGAQDYLTIGTLPPASLMRVVRYALERGRIERRLWETHRRLNTLIDNLPGVFFRSGNDSSWTMEYVSKGIQDLTGFPYDDFLGNRERSFASLIHPDDQARVWETKQAAIRERRRYTVEYRIQGSSGDLHWVWERGTGIFWENEFLALEGFITDVTDQILAERQLADTLQRFRKALEGTIVAMSRALERRDPYTAGHQRRVAELARLIARAMHLDEHRTEGLYLASLVHDVGKIAIPRRDSRQAESVERPRVSPDSDPRPGWGRNP